jgi:hypothetical protein
MARLPATLIFLHFLPHFRVPTVVVGGRSDFIFPVETSKRPMFRLLGTPEKDDRLGFVAISSLCTRGPGRPVGANAVPVLSHSGLAI